MSKDHGDAKHKRDFQLGEMKQLFDVVSEKVPNLMTSLNDLTNAPEGGKKMEVFIMGKGHGDAKDNQEIPVKDIAELLDVVSEKIPLLMKSIKDTAFSPEAGKSMGQAVGNFYKELIASGIDAELASTLTREYLSTIKSFGTTIGKDFNVHHRQED